MIKSTNILKIMVKDHCKIEDLLDNLEEKNNEDFESNEIQVRGFVVSEVCENPSNYKSEKTLDKFLKEYNIPGIQNVDTRALTRIIRNYGTLRGRICKKGVDVEKTITELKKTPYPDSKDLLPKVTRKQISAHGKGQAVNFQDQHQLAC